MIPALKKLTVICRKVILWTDVFLAEEEGNKSFRRALKHAATLSKQIDFVKKIEHCRRWLMNRANNCSVLMS